MAKYYLFLAGAVLLEVCASSCLKASQGFTRWLPTAGLALGYAGAFYLLGQTLKGMTLGVAYALWCAVGIILTALVGFIFYKERPDVPALIGMAVIVAGVLVINVFSKTVWH